MRAFLRHAVRAAVAALGPVILPHAGAHVRPKPERRRRWARPGKRGAA